MDLEAVFDELAAKPADELERVLDALSERVLTQRGAERAHDTGADSPGGA